MENGNVQKEKGFLLEEYWDLFIFATDMNQKRDLVYSLPKADS